MSERAGGSFSCQAVLFDLDGVLVDSRICIERSWTAWADRRQIDRELVLGLAHGRRTRETLQLVAPHLDPEVEIAELARAELQDLDGALAMPGARALLNALPENRWAIVTSGLRAISVARLRHVGLPIPAVFVTAEDVERGKPFPDGYLTAASRLRYRPEQCLVVEDTPPGIAAARAAGMRVIAVATTYPREQLLGADHIAGGVDDLFLRAEEDVLRLTATHS